MPSMPAATRCRRRVRLHQHVHQIELRAEPVLDQRRVEAIGISTREAALPLDNVIGPHIAFARGIAADTTAPAACAAWMRFAEPPE